MIKNYIAVALRNFWRHKTFSFINILGLAIGISASLVIYLILQYHFSFDKHHAGGDRIYRVVSDFTFSGEKYYNGGVPAPLYPALKAEVSGIAASTGFYIRGGDIAVATGDGSSPKTFKDEGGIIFTDGDYFKLFPQQWLAGSAATALGAPNRIVLSEEKAKMYFPGLGYADVIGRQLTFSDSIPVQVSGVVANQKQRTNFTFNHFVSMATAQATGLKQNFGLESWGSTNSASQVFVKLLPQTAISSVHNQLKGLMKKYRPEDNKDAANTAAWSLQSLSDIHFNSQYDTFNIPAVSKTVLYGLGAAALFLLLLGCINFINLTTAQATQRAKEIGIRKTVGGSRGQLLFQFLTETFFITGIAVVLSVVLVPFVLRIFDSFIPEGIRFAPVEQPHILLFLFGLTIVVTLLSGFYPAHVLSGYKPVLVLKNSAAGHSGKTRRAVLRQSLTVFQFVIAQVFVMATLVLGKQIHYVLNKDLGFKQEAIINFSIPFDFKLWEAGIPETKHKALKATLHSMPEIDAVSVGGAPPSSYGTSSSQIKYVDGKKEVETDVQLKNGDTAYLGLYGIKLLAGRNIRQADSATEYVINETYARVLGFANVQDAIGKSLVVNDSKQMAIVGVMADFHQRSLHEPIKPLVLSYEPANSFDFHVALKPQLSGISWQRAIATMEKKYKEIYPDEKFSYQFYDESIAKFYKADQDTRKLLNWATALSVIISCLGLFGLVIYTTNQRTKEIGIRKVLGATVAQIVAVLSKDFLVLVAIAFLIAAPITWWGAQQWLQNFAYRTSVSWWIFSGAGIGMLLLALLVLGTRTIKAAVANPVKSLRTE